MERVDQPESEIYRVILLRQASTELLLASIEGGLSLPEVTIPRWHRAAENIGAAMKSTWGEEVICLFEADGTTPDACHNRIHYQVTEHWRSVGKSEVWTRWVRMEELHQNSLVDPSDYAAIQRSLAERDTLARDRVAGPFAQLGWFKELFGWVEEVIALRGLHLSGNFRQLNASPTFSLIRFESNGPAIWFKAAGEPNQREFPITLMLSRLFPDYVAPVLAARSAWNAWLAPEVQGVNLTESSDSSLWESAAAAIANLQIESIGRHPELVASGAHDLRLESLQGLVAPVIDVAGHLMEKQSKEPPAVLSKAELRLLARRIRDAFSTLRDLEIPDTLGHLDLNPGNLIVAGCRCAFLDWAEAYVGHPFFSFQYFLEHFRRIAAAHSTSEAKLAASYLEPWKQIISHDFLADAMVCAPLLAAFTYAVGTGAWKQPGALSDPTVAGYLRSLVRRMNREANALCGRRSPCLV